MLFQPAARIADVASDLLAQRVDSGKLSLRPQSVLEGELDTASVKLPLKIDQVRLRERVLASAEGRPKPDIGDGRMKLPSGRLIVIEKAHTPGVHTWTGKDFRFGIEVGRRESKLATSPLN